MYCEKCGTMYSEGSNFCIKCGNPVHKTDDYIPLSAGHAQSYHEPGRGTVILILGILSIILLGPLVGIPAWVMGNKDLKKINNGIISVSEKSTTRTGMILGIIGTFVSVFSVIIIGIAVAVGINSMSASAQQANRDALIADCTNIASYAQQYYRKPVSLGGGGNDFTGFEIPASLKITANGEYSVENLEPGSLSVVGVGNEIGNDGNNKIKIIIYVTPVTIDVRVVN